MRRRYLRAWQLPALVAGALGLLTSCGSGSSTTSSSTTSSSSSSSSTPVNNIQPVNVSLGPTGNDVNELLTNVTVCVPGTTNCQTIANVLVDTGSTGLRLFSSAVSIALPTVKDASGRPLGNCGQFASLTYAWGPVATAEVQLAGEIAASVPIQLIDAPNFAAVPTSCQTGGTAVTLDLLGANGILGVGLFQQDCGTACTVSTGPAVYFGCPSSGCVGETVALNQQLQNPIGLFPQDNNGLVLTLPAVDPAGDTNVSGSLTFGIGTQSNNALSAVQIYTTDDNGNFSVTFNGLTYSESFLDTGSNGLFFLNAGTLGIPVCSNANSFYCPAATEAYSAITTGTNGVATTVALTIANADTLFNTGNTAFNDLGGPNVGGFDLGLPFFFGRNVYLAIQGATTSGGTGPFWAY